MATPSKHLTSENDQTSLFERHPWLFDLRPLIESIAEAASSVMIRGEHPRMCEVVARAIHTSAADRRPAAFLRVNCRESGSPMDALETALFGLSNAVGRPGKVGMLQVPQSTLYLEEIDVMPLALQARLLRVLTDRRLPQGEGRTPWPVDVRVIATANRDLADMVARGEFLAELHARLTAAQIAAPSLTREERDLVEAEEAEQARLLRARREPIDVHNEACRAFARAAGEHGLICPHCGHGSGEDIELVDHSGELLKSFFVCRVCGRSFGHEL